MYLIGVQASFSAYTGGAHPYENDKLVIYDVRDSQIVPFLDLFTPRGQELLLARVKSDLANELKETNIQSCDIEINDIWSFDKKASSYIPWRKNIEMTLKEHPPKNLKTWNISYGTYAFGCTGRPGYEMYGIPDEIIEKELNSKYFDPSTHYFYE